MYSKTIIKHKEDKLLQAKLDSFGKGSIILLIIAIIWVLL